MLYFLDKASGKPIVEADFEQPTRELFMWSILLNRVDLAMIFWDEGKDSMAASLTAAQILKVMGQKTDDFELNKEIDANIKYVWFTHWYLEGTQVWVNALISAVLENYFNVIVSHFRNADLQSNISQID